MSNGIFKLDWASIGDAIVMAAVGAVVATLYGLVTTQGFDLFTADWAGIGHSIANVAFIAVVVSLGQNFLSTDKGSVLGITPKTVPDEG